MRVQIKQIILENFKAFKGRIVFEPLREINSIIGANGRGKSNILDAVAFALNLNLKYLRVWSLSSLIYDSCYSGTKSTLQASVALNLDVGNQENLTLKRTIEDDASKYYINAHEVSEADYILRLEEINIIPNISNFMVFQGATSSLTLGIPKELTALFEKVSGSGNLASQYNKAHKRISSANKELKTILNQLIRVRRSRHKLHKVEETSKEYLNKSELYKETLVQYHLFNLYITEQKMTNITDEINNKKAELAEVRDGCSEETIIWDAKIKNIQEMEKRQDNIENGIEENRKILNGLTAILRERKNNTKRAQTKYDKSKSIMDKAQDEHNNYLNNVTTIQDERRQLGETVTKLESETSYNLNENQTCEYDSLKIEADQRCDGLLQSMASIEIKMANDQNILDQLNYTHTVTKQACDKEMLRSKEINNNLSTLMEKIQGQNQFFAGANREKSQLEEESVTCGNREKELREELQRNKEYLPDAVSRVDNLMENVEKTLKETFVNVYGRVCSLCRANNNKFHLALTRVVGSYRNAIIVDIEETAKNCILFLRQRRLARITFLALDILELQTSKKILLNESLRHIQNPPNCKLLYDVLEYPPEIDVAIRFLTHNTVVCPTMEDAEYVAFKMSERNWSVSLNGDYFQKSGIFCGGLAELIKKAKRWDTSKIKEAKQDRTRLLSELNSVIQARKILDNKLVKQNIAIDQRKIINYTDHHKSLLQAKEELDQKIAHIKCKYEEEGVIIEEKKQTIANMGLELSKLEEQNHIIEDEVFREFCIELGIENIRCLRQRFKEIDTNRKQINTVRIRMNQIDTLIKFEEQRNTESKISSWQEKVTQDVKKLKSCELAEASQEAKVIQLKEKLNKLEQEKSKTRLSIGQMHSSINEKNEQTMKVKRAITCLRNKISSLKSNLQLLKSERKTELDQIKTYNISIPLVERNADNVLSSDSDKTKTSDEDIAVTIDYSQLPNYLKQKMSLRNVNKIKSDLQEKMNNAKALLEAVDKPEVNVLQETSLLNESHTDLQVKKKNIENMLKNHQRKFDSIKMQRIQLFQTCFNTISTTVDEVYKRIYGFGGVQALLILVNPTEPYLDGVDYQCMAPGRSMQSLNSLSGAELTIAYLSLVYAICSFQRVPFLFFDEIDVMWDNELITAFARYLLETRGDFQTFIISHNVRFFKYAQCCIGVYTQKTANERPYSDAVSLDLMQFEL